MKKIFFPVSLAIAFIILSGGSLFSQSDKEIIKAANIDIKDKDYDLAFKKIVTVSDPEKKKVQEVLKKAYPNLIADYLTKAGAVKLSDKDSAKVKCEKLEQIVGYLNEGMITDSIFKSLAQPDLYKSLSKKKKIESTMKTSSGKLKTLKDNIVKHEKAIRVIDSIRQDSIRQTLKIDSVSMDNSSSQQAVNTEEVPVVSNTGNAPQTTDNSGVKMYYIIAGSYKSEADAQAAVSNLKSQGYASEIVGQNAYGNFRISYSGFSSKDDAFKELEKIKLVQADAWILEK